MAGGVKLPPPPREPLLRGPASPGLPPGTDQVQEQGGTLFTRAAVPSYAIWYLSPKQNSQGFRPRALCSFLARQGWGTGSVCCLSIPRPAGDASPLRPPPPHSLLQQLSMKHQLSTKHTLLWVLGRSQGNKADKNPVLGICLPAAEGRGRQTEN